MRAAEVPSEFRLLEETLDPDATKHFEGAFTQGSGYLHVRGSFEEGLAAAAQDEAYVRLPANVTLEKPRHPRSKWGTYVPGITGLHPLLRQELVNLPYFMDLRVFADGEPLDMDRCRLDGYDRFLDLRDGVLHRRFAWRTAGGAVLEASYRRFVSRKRQRLCVQEVAYRCLAGKVLLRIESGIDARVRTNGHDHFASVRVSTRDSGALVEVVTDTGDRVAVCSRVRAEGLAFVPLPGVERRPACTAEARLRPGAALRIVKISAVAPRRDAGIGADIASVADAEVESAFAAADRLYGEHAAEWAAMWKASAVRIGGDPRAQHALNFALHHLLRAANPRDARASICAKGSAGKPTSATSSGTPRSTCCRATSTPVPRPPAGSWSSA